MSNIYTPDKKETQALFNMLSEMFNLPPYILSFKLEFKPDNPVAIEIRYYPEVKDVH